MDTIDRIGAPAAGLRPSRPCCGRPREVLRHERMIDVDREDYI